MGDIRRLYHLRQKRSIEKRMHNERAAIFIADLPE